MTHTTITLDRGEPFVHTVPRSYGLRYTFVPLSFAGQGVVAVEVDGEIHDLCRRCGEGYGHYSWNGEDDICYECNGEAFGRQTDEADVIRRAVNRAKVAERKERKWREAQAAKAAAIAAWTEANADLAAALEAHLPPSEIDEFEGYQRRGPALTFLAKLAVQVADERKPLSARQAEVAREAIAKNAARNEARLAAGHWGTVGKRAEVSATVNSCKAFESDYGTRWLVTMTSTEGHALKTWTSGQFIDTALDAVKDHRVVNLKATVKAHVDYQGVPQTELSRVAEVAR